MSLWARRVTNICLTACNLQNPVSKNRGGLKGEQIRLTSQILQVTDIYAALTTDRPYGTAFPRGSHSQRSAKRHGEDGWGISLLDEFESFSGVLAARAQRTVA
jgi:hypothetical protein